MPTKSLFLVLVVAIATAISSCKKSENFVCRNPTASDLHGVWSQDYYVDPIAFQPSPDWERIEFRQDSFFMKIVVSAEHLTALDCYLRKWDGYAKGIYTVVNDRIAFTGILTDSNYVEKNSGCHENGLYNARFAIEYCGSNFVMKILSADTVVANASFVIKMLRTKELCDCRRSYFAWHRKIAINKQKTCLKLNEASSLFLNTRK